MKAIVIRGAMDIAVEERPSLRIDQDDQVLVDVKVAGICGSDLHTVLGERPIEIYPRIPGHEFVGIVNQVGRGATRFKPGDRVAVEPILTCGTCYACGRGRRNVCRTVKTAGVHFDGGMREQFLTTVDKLFPIPDGLTFRQAVLAEPYTIGVQVNEHANTAPGDVVLIHGAGPIGLTVMDVARQLGAICIVSEIKEARLQMAKDFGADYCINPSCQNARDEVMKITGGVGPRTVIDAAGIPSVLTQGVDWVARSGTVVNMCFSPKQVPFDLASLLSKGARIVGSRLQNDKFPVVFEKYAERLKAAERIITHAFPVEEGKQAFELFAQNRADVGKIIVTFGP